MIYPTLEFRKVIPEFDRNLGDFFCILHDSNDQKYFNPHPLTLNEAKTICNYHGKDLYYTMIEDGLIFGYGMLRGWDEGYETPSLGIAIHPSVRGMGLGTAFIHFLHAAAKRRGAKKIRLKVYATNKSALKLYTTLGYSFDCSNQEHFIGTKLL